MALIDVIEHRRSNFSLDDDQRLLAQSLSGFFAKNCSPAVVRQAQPRGHDDSLYEALAQLGMLALSVPGRHGGDDGTLTDAVVVAEAAGTAAAPVALIESMVAARLLSTVLDLGDSVSARNALEAVLSGELVATLLFESVEREQLAPAGAVAGVVLGLRGEELVLISTEPSPLVENAAALPIARWKGKPENAVVVASGVAASAAYHRALNEWRILTASALASLTEFAVREAVEFAKTRQTRGVAIGSLQAISHKLVDAHIGAQTARNLARKAAWYNVSEPSAHPDLGYLALAAAAHAAAEGTAAAVQVEGGQGVSLESGASVAALRAKGWANIAGDPRRLLVSAGRLIVERAARENTE